MLNWCKVSTGRKKNNQQQQKPIKQQQKKDSYALYLNFMHLYLTGIYIK